MQRVPLAGHQRRNPVINISEIRERAGQTAFVGASWPPDQSHPVAAGHTGKITRGRWPAEMLCEPSLRTGGSNQAGGAVIANGSLRGLFWPETVGALGAC